MGKYDLDEWETRGDDYHARSRDGICDSECRGANGCSGHVECIDCGSVICGCEADDDGRCSECAAKRESEDEEGEPK